MLGKLTKLVDPKFALGLGDMIPVATDPRFGATRQPIAQEEKEEEKQPPQREEEKQQPDEKEDVEEAAVEEPAEAERAAVRRADGVTFISARDAAAVDCGTTPVALAGRPSAAPYKGSAGRHAPTPTKRIACVASRRTSGLPTLSGTPRAPICSSRVEQANTGEERAIPADFGSSLGVCSAAATESRTERHICSAAAISKLARRELAPLAAPSPCPSSLVRALQCV